MSEAEEKYMRIKNQMQCAIDEYYKEGCPAIGLDNDGFMDDINDAVFDATDGKCKFEEWIE